MSEIFFLLLAAALAFGFSRLLKIPPIPLLVLSGIGLHALAQMVYGELPEDILQSLIELGLAVLVFTAGVELSPRRMKNRSRAITIVASIQFVVLGIAGAITALALGYSMIIALYIGTALSASSTLVVVRQLQQRRQMYEPYGRLVLGVLLLQDLFIIFVLVFLIKMPDGAMAITTGLAGTVGLALLAVVLHIWLVPQLAKKVKLDDEELLLLALSTLFVFSALSALLNLPFLVGAFFGGFALSAFPMNGLVRGMLNSLSSFFLALFFICIGAVLTWPSVPSLIHALILIAVLLIITILLVTYVAEKVGISTRSSIEAGLLLSQTSEFSLLLALVGLFSGQIDSDTFTMIALITIVTMTITPLIAQEKVAWRLMRFHPKYRKGRGENEPMAGHAVIIGFGRAGRATLELLKGYGLNTIIVDDDAAVVKKLLDKGELCVQGDGTQDKILQMTSSKKAKVILTSVRRVRDSLTIIRKLKDSDVSIVVRTLEDNEAREIEKAGATPYLATDISVKKFLEWLAVNFEADAPKKNESEAP